MGSVYKRGAKLWVAFKDAKNNRVCKPTGLDVGQEKQAREKEDKVKENEKEVGAAEEHANRFDLAEALLEIGLVITSVTLLTRNRVYWYFGIVFSLGGIASALSVLLLK